MDTRATAEPSKFEIIYQAACDRDLETSTRMSKVSNLAVSKGGLSVITKLLVDGERDAVNFLRENFVIEPKHLIRSYSRINDVNEVQKILATLDESFDPIVIYNCLISSLMGYTICNNKDELNKTIDALKKLKVNIRNVEKDILVTTSMSLIIRGNEIEALLFINNHPEVTSAAINLFAYQGKLDIAIQLAAKEKDKEKVLSLYSAIVSGLFQGEHDDKLDIFLKSIPSDLHDSFQADKAHGLALRGVEAVESIIEIKPVDRIDFFSLLVDGYIRFGNHKAAEKVLELGNDRRERKHIIAKLIQGWVLNLCNPQRAIDFINRTENEKLSEKIALYFIETLSKVEMYNFAFNLIAVVTKQNHKDLYIARMMMHFAAQDDQRNITLLFSKVSAEDQLSLKELMIFGYVRGNRTQNIIKYAETLNDFQDVAVFYHRVITACFRYEQFEAIVDYSVIAGKKETTKDLWKQRFDFICAEGDNSLDLIDYLKSHPESKIVGMVKEYVNHLAQWGEVEEIQKFLLTDQSLRLKFYPIIINGLLSFDHFDKSVEIYQYISNNIPSEALLFIRLVIPNLCNAGLVRTLIRMMSNANSFDDLSAMCMSINSQLYKAKCFSSRAATVSELALVPDVTIRKILAKELQRHKNSDEYNTDKLLAAVEERLNTSPKTSPAFFASNAPINIPFTITIDPPAATFEADQMHAPKMGI